MTVLDQHGDVGQPRGDVLRQRVERFLHRLTELVVGHRGCAPHAPAPFGRRSKPMACSRAWAASSIAESLNAGPAIWNPTGSSGPPPSGSARPAGMEIAGMPARGMGTVQ